MVSFVVCFVFVVCLWLTCLNFITDGLIVAAGLIVVMWWVVCVCC